MEIMAEQFPGAFSGYSLDVLFLLLLYIQIHISFSVSFILLLATSNQLPIYVGDGVSSS